uniref:Uncharacterized protein n=1 Tax=Magallana gigas TaxID=29159 RepID=K1PIU6_MAGGI
MPADKMDYQKDVVRNMVKSAPASVHNMRVRFETSLARSKDYVPLRKRPPSCVKVETEKDVKVETEIDNETYMEMNTTFPAGPESCVSYSTYISSPANYNHILPSYACSSVSVDLSLSRPGMDKIEECEEHGLNEEFSSDEEEKELKFTKDAKDDEDLSTWETSEKRRKFDFENESIDVPVVPKACVFRCGSGETQLYLFEFVYYHTDMNNVSFAAILILPTPLVFCGEE